MKRICILFALFCCLLSAPFSLSAHRIVPDVMMEETDLPWSTVDAVLKAVEDQTEWSYSQLVGWYHANRLTVNLIDGDYVVSFLDDDGLAQVVILENL